MKNNEAVSQLLAEIESFTSQPIEPVPGYSFVDYDVKKRIHKYDLSQFYGDVPADAKFYNIINFRRDNLVSYIDVDLKDIRFIPDKSVPRPLFSLFKKEVLDELKNSKTTKVFNDLAKQLVTFGSTAVRHYSDHEKVVDFRNFFYEPNVESLQDSRFVIQRHFYTKEKLKQVAKEKNWDLSEVEKIIQINELAQTRRDSSYIDDGSSGLVGASLYEVYERFGYIDGLYLEGEQYQEGEQYKSYSVYVEPRMFNQNESGEKKYVGNIVFSVPWNKDYPYSECHLNRVAGRWLGVGIYEALFPLQERFNEIMYAKQTSMKISTLTFFQTSDPLVLDNVLDELVAGDVVRYSVGGSGLQPVPNQERNLGAFQNEADNISVLADNLSYTSDINRGTNIPSTMPATNAVLANNNVVRVTLQKREDFVFFISDYINTYVLPRVEKKLNKESVVTYISQGESDPINQAIATAKRNQVATTAVLTGESITNEQLDEVEQKEKAVSEKFIKKVKDAYKGISTKVEVIADNEQTDLNAVAQNTLAFLQLISSNPQLLQGGLRNAVLDYGETIGVNVENFSDANVPAPQPAEVTSSSPNPTL